MSKKVVITGATGLIGKKIARRLIDGGDEVTIFTRSVDNSKAVIPYASDYVHWAINSPEWKQHLEGKDAVINLAGENLMAKRWSPEHKKNIRESRILSTRALINVINELKNKPKVFVSASAIGYYGNSETEVDETSPRGDGFLAGVVDEWEKESEPLEKYGVRRVIIRIGIVLDKNEGALAKMILPFKLFAGGPLGSGNQWMSWIHIDDLVNLFLFAVDNENIEGTVNGVSPNPVTMKEFARATGRALNRPSVFRVPEFILYLLLGEAAEVIAGGAKVDPKRAVELGYNFEYKDFETAVRNLLR